MHATGNAKCSRGGGWVGRGWLDTVRAGPALTAFTWLEPHHAGICHKGAGGVVGPGGRGCLCGRMGNAHRQQCPVAGSGAGLARMHARLRAGAATQAKSRALAAKGAGGKRKAGGFVLS